MTDGSIIPFDMGRTLAFEFPRFFTSSSTNKKSFAESKSNLLTSTRSAEIN